MLNAAPLYCTIKKIQRFEDRVIWRVYGRFSRAITPFFSPGNAITARLLPQSAECNAKMINILLNVAYDKQECTNAFIYTVQC